MCIGCMSRMNFGHIIRTNSKPPEPEGPLTALNGDLQDYMSIENFQKVE